MTGENAVGPDRNAAGTGAIPAPGGRIPGGTPRIHVVTCVQVSPHRWTPTCDHCGRLVYAVGHGQARTIGAAHVEWTRRNPRAAAALAADRAAQVQTGPWVSQHRLQFAGDPPRTLDTLPALYAG